MTTNKHGLVDGIEFSEPPPPRAGKYDWSSIADKLLAKPGEWALIYTKDKTTYASSIRGNCVNALKREHGFVSRTANNTTTPGDRTCSLWLMYDPSKDSRIPVKRKKGKA